MIVNNMLCSVGGGGGGGGESSELFTYEYPLKGAVSERKAHYLAFSYLHVMNN